MNKKEKLDRSFIVSGAEDVVISTPLVGDVILVHGGSWLAKQIQHWMNKYRIKKGLEPRVLWNHVAVIIDLWGQQYIAEAQAKGVQIIPDVDKYLKNNTCKVKTWVKPLNTQEKNLFSKTAVEYALIPHRYDFLNFFYQMYYITTGKWIGPKDIKANKRVYCSEFAAIVMDKVRNAFNGKTYDKNPLDIDICPALKDK